MAKSNTLQFYLDRAEQAREDAEAATLSHVRDRCRRSEAAWTQMAKRAAATKKAAATAIVGSPATEIRHEKNEED